MGFSLFFFLRNFNAELSYGICFFIHCHNKIETFYQRITKFSNFIYIFFYLIENPNSLKAINKTNELFK